METILLMRSGNFARIIKLRTLNVDTFRNGSVDVFYEK